MMTKNRITDPKMIKTESWSNKDVPLLGRVYSIPKKSAAFVSRLSVFTNSNKANV